MLYSITDKGPKSTSPNNILSQKINTSFDAIFSVPRTIVYE